MNGEREAMDNEPCASMPLRSRQIFPTYPAGLVKKTAYIFDGLGNFFNKEWDLADLHQNRERESKLVDGRGNELSWYHVELPKENQKLSVCTFFLLLAMDLFVHMLMGRLYPGLIHLVLPPGLLLEVQNSVITVSLGRVPRLGCSRMGESLLSEIPTLESSPHFGDQQKQGNGIVIKEHVLEFLVTMNHSEEADNLVPRSVSNLVVHIIDTHVDQLQDLVTKLEMELGSVELALDKGNFCQ